MVGTVNLAGKRLRYLARKAMATEATAASPESMPPYAVARRANGAGGAAGMATTRPTVVPINSRS